MRIIYKYELPNQQTTLELPWGAQVLTAQLQGDTMVLWAHIDQDETRRVRRTFVVLNTGVSFDIPGPAYISTVTSANGIVWHIFEVQ